MISFTSDTNFFGNLNPEALVQEYGSPLYVYNENILRSQMKKMKNLISYPGFTANYSIKANSNFSILKMALEEGLNVDAMSPGEIYVLLKAGFPKEKIFFVPNNVSAEELSFAISHDIMTSLDSLSQLELYGSLHPGGKCAVRLNPGVGAGHHEKVVTAGKKTKFGIAAEDVSDILVVAGKYNLTICGINQHIGSLFMDGTPYLQAIENFLSFAKQFPDLDFIDFGGGFGIPYKKLDGQDSFELEEFGKTLDAILKNWVEEYGRSVVFKSEPGRFVVAEGCVLLGRVHAMKKNSGVTYCGTDLGMNVLVRPSMYDSWHDMEVFRNGSLLDEKESKTVTVVGNICESGDIMAKDRELPPMEIGDIVCVLDAGAYGYSMASNYNNRLRPAEVLIQKDGSAKLIRRRDTFEDLVRNFPEA